MFLDTLRQPGQRNRCEENRSCASDTSSQKHKSPLSSQLPPVLTPNAQTVCPAHPLSSSHPGFQNPPTSLQVPVAPVDGGGRWRYMAGGSYLSIWKQEVRELNTWLGRQHLYRETGRVLQYQRVGIQRPVETLGPVAWICPLSCTVCFPFHNPLTWFFLRN